MRVCLTCVYWMLLLVSVVSSALLFLIVASEGIQGKHRSTSRDKTETFAAYDNVTLDSNETVDLESSAVFTEVHNPLLKTGHENQYNDEVTTMPASFESATSEEARKNENTFVDSDVLTESLTQQPNLSQGISETGQAVVLTLVDTATAELQSLAEPKIDTEFSKVRSYAKNSTLLTSDASVEQKSDEESRDSLPSTQIPSPLVIGETTERPNDTEALEEGLLLMKQSIVEEPPEAVVVVRAEQKPIASEGFEYAFEDDDAGIVTDEVAKVEDVFTTVPELNDTAARAHLAAGTRDEAAAVVLGDGIVASGPTDPHEDIPSFSEWAQKRLEEAEKKKTHPNASVQNPGGPGRGVGGMKVRSKNYASPDCGAKIVAANPEARSARSVLATTRDEYMLNTCTSRIWFVVELCEAIQAKKIELANFELFSSSPKDFSVYVSDRFPTREWSPVGQFTAKDTKDIQSFALHPHLFGKFIKVELQTYYGSEHFCPISLFHAYGTSEFEVLETETENQVSRETTPDADDEDESDEEELLHMETGTPQRNLFGSARDAVISIVKKAAEVLVKSSDLTGNNITNIQQSIDNGNILENSYVSCATPSYTILCGNCSDQKFAKVFQLISCRERQLNQWLMIDLVNETLRQGTLCKVHGVEIDTFAKKKEELDAAIDENVNSDRTMFDPQKNFQMMFLTSVLNPEYIVALCNVLATNERKMVMNTSYEVLSNSSADSTKEDAPSSKTANRISEPTDTLHHVSSTCTLASSSDNCKPTSFQESRRRTEEPFSEEPEEITGVPIETSSSLENVASQVKPTKTLGKEDTKKDPSIPVLEADKEATGETMQEEVLTTLPPSSNIAIQPTLKISEESSIIGTSTETVSQTIIPGPVVTIDSQEFSGDNAEADVTASFEVSGTPGKMEKPEQIDQEGKQGKADIGEQEIKLSSQDPLTFDTLLSDLKDFEGAGAASMAQPTANTMPQKESVFLRLSNRIKALERNMSLSGQYLEELSRRYKKQVEEMQRSLERAVSAMGEESRKGEERELKRLEEIAALREQIASLSKSVESLLYDRDSWRGRFSAISQHALLICFEILVVILILSYCRKIARFENEGKQCGQSSLKKDSMRRKSAENFGSHMRKSKKRRPSEIASHITGTYRELMIEDRSQERKKERKRKRRKEAAMAGHRAIVGGDDVKGETSLVRYKSVPNFAPDVMTVSSRRASSVDTPTETSLQSRVDKSPEFTVETMAGWLDEQSKRKVNTVEVTAPEETNFEVESEKSSEIGSSRIGDFSGSNSSSANVDGIGGESTPNEQSGAESLKEVSSSRKTGGILKTGRLSTSSSFMRAALGSRKKRRPISNDGSQSKNSDNLNDKSPSSAGEKLFSATIHSANGNTAENGELVDESDESRSSTATPTSEKKGKKSTGLKKMVRKLF